MEILAEDVYDGNCILHFRQNVRNIGRVDGMGALVSNGITYKKV
jgi:hypothetical protein